MHGAPHVLAGSDALHPCYIYRWYSTGGRGEISDCDEATKGIRFSETLDPRQFTSVCPTYPCVSCDVITAQIDLLDKFERETSRKSIKAKSTNGKVKLVTSIEK